jgi:hypothetical protein
MLVIYFTVHQVTASVLLYRTLNKSCVRLNDLAPTSLVVMSSPT